MTRMLLVIIVLAFFILCAAAMWWGYRNRARRQSAMLPTFPTPPEDIAALGAELLPSASGVYVSTTTDASWQDRVAIGDIGFRSAAVLRLFHQGLLVDRSGASPLWIPAAALRDIRTGQGLAGKVMLGDDLLIVRWQAESQLFDTGFLPDDRTVYHDWITAVRAMIEPVAARGSEQ